MQRLGNLTRHWSWSLSPLNNPNNLNKLIQTSNMCNRRQFARRWLLFFSHSRQFWQWSTWAVQNKVEANKKQQKTATKTFSAMQCLKKGKCLLWSWPWSVSSSQKHLAYDLEWRMERNKRTKEHISLTSVCLGKSKFFCDIGTETLRKSAYMEFSDFQ